MFHGEEKNTYQNEDPGVEIDEMVEMYFSKQKPISIHFQNIDIKKSSQLIQEKEEENKICTERMLKILF